ncbi:MAG: ABC transporter substrate-binding protein [Mycobacteriales bacterium]
MNSPIRHRARFVSGLALACALAITAAACGSGSGGGKGATPSGSNTSAGTSPSPSGSGGGGGTGKKGGTGSPVTIGTTDKVVSFDPSGSYDLGSFTPMYSMYQTLVLFPPQTTTPTPDAAQKCEFTDPTHYVCTMRANQQFWNGDPVTAKDVVFSFQRNLKIAAPNGASSLLQPMKSVAAAGDKVTFTLKYPFAVFPFVLSDPSNAIVDSKVFAPTKLQADDKIVGSGPYEMKSYKPGQQLVLVPNPHYGGNLKLSNSGVVVTYYSTESALKLDLENGVADVGYRTFSASTIAALRKDSGKGVQVVEGQGAEIQYIVFNTKTQAGSTPAQKLAVRQAVAMSINRQQIASSVYNNTVTPLYSMIPVGLAGHTDAFKTAYGASPDPAKAKQALRNAHVTTPVNLDLWWTPSHYGEPSADMYTTIKRQLEATGLFKVSLHSSEWESYSKAYPTDQFPSFQLGWFPDYPDPDDYVAPFYGTTTSFLNDHFSNSTIDKAILKERGSDNQTTRNTAFAQIQQIGAQQAPTIPIWQGKQIAVQRTGVTGVKSTLDASYTFRFWLIGKS